MWRNSNMIKRALTGMVSPARNLLKDTIYPQTCAMCGQRGSWVCDICISDFTPLVADLCCDRCGHPTPRGRCECRNMHPAIVKARSSNVYDGWIAKSVHAFKYDREPDRALHLAESMEPAFVELDNVDAIIPVPLHRKRQEWRGFNQAELLARHLGEIQRIPMESALIRLRETETQAQGSREERLSNVEGAFGVNPGWSLDRGAHYVLLDDVYTTGATVGSCAEALDAAGAKTISVVTLAFDLHPKDLELYQQQLMAAST